MSIFARFENADARCRRWLRGMTLGVALVFVGSASAEGLLFGDEFQEIGPVIPEGISSAQGKTGAFTSTVGYHYRHLGPVGMTLWTWGGSYCLHHGDTNWNIDKLEAGYLSGRNPDSLTAPFFERIPFGLFAFVLIGAGIGWLVSKGKSWRDGLIIRLLSRLPMEKAEIDEMAKKLHLEPAPAENAAEAMMASFSSGKIARPKSAKSSGKIAQPKSASASGKMTGRPADPVPSASPAETFSLQQETPVMAGATGSTITRMVSKDELQATLRDPLYQKAIKLVLEGSSSLSGLSMDPADRQIELKVGLDFLVKNGVDKIAARPRLIAAVRAVARAQRRRLQGGEKQG